MAETKRGSTGGPVKSSSVESRHARAGSVLTSRHIRKLTAVSATDLSSRLRLNKRELAETPGISVATLQRKSRASAPSVSARLSEMAEIIHRVSEWTGGELQALAWYRSEPLPAFGDRTAESLVKSGKASSVRDYLDHLALGGFA